MNMQKFELDNNYGGAKVSISTEKFHLFLKPSYYMKWNSCVLFWHYILRLCNYCIPQKKESHTVFRATRGRVNNIFFSFCELLGANSLQEISVHRHVFIFQHVGLERCNWALKMFGTVFKIQQQMWHCKHFCLKYRVVRHSACRID